MELIKTQLGILRDALTLTQSMNTYLYKEGIGLVETIDENGQSVYYEYDGFNRLKNVRDFQGNYTQFYEYNMGFHSGGQ